MGRLGAWVLLVAPLVLFVRPVLGGEETASNWMGPELRIPVEDILAAQPGYGLEWWYSTGHLRGDGRDIGFELTFFRATAPAAQGDPAFSTGNAYVAHFALTFPEGRFFHFEERSSRGAFGEAGASSEDFRVWIRDWEMRGLDQGGAMALRAGTAEGYRLELELRPSKPPVFHGEGGYSRKGADPRDGSFYVSWTRLAAEGGISFPDGRRAVVDGEAWFDREITTPPEKSDVAGWDWFGIQLEDGTDIMLYRILDDTGDVSPWSAGTWVDPAGRTTHLDHGDIVLRPRKQWASDRTGVVYDTRWDLELPEFNVKLTVSAEIDDQELRTYRSTRNAYWEGKSSVSGTRNGEALAGSAYLEMNRWAFRKAGKP